MLYRGRKDLDTITSADILTSFDAIRRDYARLTAASAIAEIVDKITPDRERAFSTDALLVGGLQALADDKGATVVPAFLVKLLSLCGYHPELKACAGCGDAGRQRRAHVDDGRRRALGGRSRCRQRQPDSDEARHRGVHRRGRGAARFRRGLVRTGLGHMHARKCTRDGDEAAFSAYESAAHEGESDGTDR